MFDELDVKSNAAEQPSLNIKNISTQVLCRAHLLEVFGSSVKILIDTKGISLNSLPFLPIYVL